MMNDSFYSPSQEFNNDNSFYMDLPMYNYTYNKRDDMYLSYDSTTKEYTVLHEIHLGEDSSNEYIIQRLRSKNDFECIQYIKNYFEAQGNCYYHNRKYSY